MKKVKDYGSLICKRNSQSYLELNIALWNLVIRDKNTPSLHPAALLFFKQDLRAVNYTYDCNTLPNTRKL